MSSGDAARPATVRVAPNKYVRQESTAPEASPNPAPIPDDDAAPSDDKPDPAPVVKAKCNLCFYFISVSLHFFRFYDFGTFSSHP